MKTIMRILRVMAGASFVLSVGFVLYGSYLFTRAVSGHAVAVTIHITAFAVFGATLLWVVHRLKEREKKRAKYKDPFGDIVEERLAPYYWAEFEEQMRHLQDALKEENGLTHFISSAHEGAWKAAKLHFDEAYRTAILTTGQYPDYKETKAKAWGRFAKKAAGRFDFGHPVFSSISDTSKLVEAANDLTREV